MHDDKTTSITSVMTTGRQNDSVDSNTQTMKEKNKGCVVSCMNLDILQESLLPYCER